MVSQMESHLVSWLITRGDSPNETPRQPLWLSLGDPDGPSPGELLELLDRESPGKLDGQSLRKLLGLSLGELFGLSNG